MKVLIVSCGALGDFITTLPAIQAITSANPAAAVTLVTRREYIPLAYLVGGFAVVAGMEMEFRCTDYDRVYSFNGMGWRPGVTCVDERANVPPMPRSAFLMSALGLTGETVPTLPVPRIPLPEGERAVAVHCGFDRGPRWSNESWQAIVTGLAAHFTVRLIAGVREGVEVQRLVERLDKAALGKVTVIYDRPLDEVARQLASCIYFVAHDSGIGHLAAAVGVPGVIAHFQNEAHGRVWCPPSPGVTLLPYSTSPLGVVNFVLAASKQ